MLLLQLSWLLPGGIAGKSSPKISSPLSSDLLDVLWAVGGIPANNSYIPAPISCRTLSSSSSSDPSLLSPMIPFGEQRICRAASMRLSEAFSLSTVVEASLRLMIEASRRLERIDTQGPSCNADVSCSHPLAGSSIAELLERRACGSSTGDTGSSATPSFMPSLYPCISSTERAWSLHCSTLLELTTLASPRSNITKSPAPSSNSPVLRRTPSSDDPNSVPSTIPMFRQHFSQYLALCFFDRPLFPEIFRYLSLKSRGAVGHCMRWYLCQFLAA
mmetsp:Transcript_23417/g.69309  ORF Transcript_23417/g.69309 Transcript_23417/m.69309 type:complete len:274 (-) Transcript_23417:370-1191(-)